MDLWTPPLPKFVGGWFNVFHTGCMDTADAIRCFVGGFCAFRVSRRHVESWISMVETVFWPCEA